MAVTIQQDSLHRQSLGSSYGITGELNLDASYPTGGYTIRAEAIGLSQFFNFETANSGGLITEIDLSVDKQSAKLLVYTAGSVANHAHGPGTFLTNETATEDEIIVVNPGTGVGAALVHNPDASIQMVFVTAGGVTGYFTQVPAATALATKTYHVNMTTGVITFLIADAVTQAKVSYLRTALPLTGVSGFTTPASTAGAEVANGTDLSAFINIQFSAQGV